MNLTLGSGAVCPMYMIHSTLEIIGPGRIWFASYTLIGQVRVTAALEASTLILTVYFAKMSSIVKLPTYSFGNWYFSHSKVSDTTFELVYISRLH